MADKGTLPHYAVELDSMTRQGAATNPRSCPICGKAGRWQGDTFVPASERQAGYPRCYCATIHAGGGYAFDPVTKQVLRRPETNKGTG
jgi:hypothetical protein